jgi:ribose transport system permease protein
VYVVSGVLAAAAGVLSTARQGASDPSFVGLLIELSAITAVVVGGHRCPAAASASSAR